MKDKQLFWIVFLAAVFWIGVWKHEAVGKFLHKASTDLVDSFQRRH